MSEIAPHGFFKSQPTTVEHRSGALRVWDWADQRAKYVVGVDVAEGKVRDLGAGRRRPGMDILRDRPDYSAAVVIELDSAKHVATWHGYVEPSEFAGVVCALGRTYNNALLVPEITGPGLAVVDVLIKVFRYPRIYRRKTWNRDVADFLTTEYGWSTSRTTRPLLIQRVHEWIASGGSTRDAELIKEIRTMEYDDQGVARGRHRNKDDRVLALSMALQGRYETLYSKLGDEQVDPRSDLDGYTRRLWDSVRKQQEASLRARRLDSSGDPRDFPHPRVGPLPRVP